MTDYCLKNLDQAEFDGLMLLAGLGAEMAGEGGRTSVQPASCEVLIDRIGPITVWDYSVEPPAEIVYPEYYSNLRLLFAPTAEQIEALAPFAVDPSQPQYRVWS